jgi:hypothetical protein
MPPNKNSGKRKSSAPQDNRQQRQALAAHNGDRQINISGSSVLTDQSNQRRTSSASTNQGGASQKTQRSYSATLGLPRTITGPPSVVAVSGEDSNLHVAGENQCKVWFEACQNSGRLTNKALLEKDISTYVRYTLFPDLKFIMSDNQLHYSTDPSTLSRIICKAMGMVEPTVAVTWWEAYKDMIADVLNAKRADVTGALKKVFMRK